MDPAAANPAAGPRVLVCGWAGAGNLGDELLAAVLVGWLREEGAVAVVASRDPAATTRSLEVESVDWGRGSLAAAAAVDAVLVGPGGILQDESSLWSLPGHLLPALRARRRGLPVAAVGVGAEPLTRASSRRLLRAALEGRPVVTRDPASSQALEAAGLTALTGADLAFAAPPRSVARADEVVVAIGPSTRPGRLLPASRRVVPVAVEVVAPALAAVAAGRPVVLTAFRGERDLDAARRLAVFLGDSATVVAGDAGLDRVAGAALVVSSRYHAALVAARAGVPVLVVSQQPKLRSLAAQLGPAAATIVEGWPRLLRAAQPPGEPVASPAGIGVARAAVAALVAAAARSGTGSG